MCFVKVNEYTKKNYSQEEMHFVTLASQIDTYTFLFLSSLSCRVALRFVAFLARCPLSHDRLIGVRELLAGRGANEINTRAAWKKEIKKKNSPRFSRVCLRDGNAGERPFEAHSERNDYRLCESCTVAKGRSRQ